MNEKQNAKNVKNVIMLRSAGPKEFFDNWKEMTTKCKKMQRNAKQMTIENKWKPNAKKSSYFLRGEACGYTTFDFSNLVMWYFATIPVETSIFYFKTKNVLQKTMFFQNTTKSMFLDSWGRAEHDADGKNAKSIIFSTFLEHLFKKQFFFFKKKKKK